MNGIVVNLDCPLLSLETFNDSSSNWVTNLCTEGVLLYILVYGENPFYDASDTVRAELHPPHLEVHTLFIISSYLYIYLACLFMLVFDWVLFSLLVTDKRQNGWADRSNMIPGKVFGWLELKKIPFKKIIFKINEKSG